MTEFGTRDAEVDEIDLSRDNDVSLSTALRRRIGLILAATAVLGLLAGGFAYLRPIAYTSTVRLQLGPLPGNPLNDNAVYNAQEIAVAMSSEAATVDSLPVVAGTGIAAGSSKIKVSPILNTTSLTIAYTADSSSRAIHGANTLGLAFLTYRNKVATDIDLSAGTQLRNLQTQALRQLQALRTAAEHTTPTAAQAADIAKLSNEVIELQKAIAKTRASTPNTTVKLAAPAVSATTSSKKLRLVLPVAGALLGFLAAAGYAMWRSRNERTIHGADHVAVAGRPVLAHLTGRQRGSGPQEDDGGALRRARVGLLARAVPHSVVVVSPVGTDGAVDRDLNGDVAHRLARSLSGAGFRVVVVDCRQVETSRERAPRAKRRHRSNAAAQASGSSLDELLKNGWVAGTTSARPGRVDVVHAARRPLGTDQMRLPQLLHIMSREYDFVIVEADSAATPSGLAAAFAGDHLVLTAVDRVTRYVDAERVVERTTRIGVSIVGVVVTSRSRFMRVDAGQGGADGDLQDDPAARVDVDTAATGWIPDSQ